MEKFLVSYIIIYQIILLYIIYRRTADPKPVPNGENEMSWRSQGHKYCTLLYMKCPSSYVCQEPDRATCVRVENSF